MVSNDLLYMHILRSCLNSKLILLQNLANCA